jgi:TIR domain
MAHVSDKMGLVNNAGAKGGATFFLAMRHVAEDAQRDRQNAVSFGARSFSDPKWCAPALVEQWAHAWLAMKQGRISRHQFDRIDATLWEVINEALSPEELLEASHQSAPKLFLSYRREDSAGYARSLYGALAQDFGADNVFFDVNSIGAGERFEAELRKALSQSAVFVAIIGQHWLRLLNERLQTAEPDYVKMEVETALQRDLVVIPVLLSRDGKTHPVPRAQELPSAVRDLFSYQMHIVSHERFERDVADLVAAIRTQVRERASQRWMTIPRQLRLDNAEAQQASGASQAIEGRRIGAIELTLRLNDALKGFMAIDEDVFRASVWRAIGVSRIPFDTHRSELTEIARELAMLATAAQRYEERTYAIVAIYAERLRKAVLLLEGICAGLELKAQAREGPSWAEYSLMVDEYSEAKKSYSALGSDLNQFRRDARLLEERERSGSKE